MGRARKVVSCLSSFDVVFLQETFVCSEEKGKNFEGLWNGEVLWSFGSGKSAGVGIAFKRDENMSVVDVRRDGEGRVLSVLMNICGVRCSLLCVYAPVDLRKRKALFCDLNNYVFPGSNVILGGGGF